MLTFLFCSLFILLLLLVELIEQREAFAAIKAKNERLMAELVEAENKALAQARFADFCG